MTIARQLARRAEIIKRLPTLSRQHRRRAEAERELEHLTRLQLRREIKSERRKAA